MKLFSSSLRFITLLCFVQTGTIFGQESSQITGPLVGHTDSNTSHIWLRTLEEGTYTLEVKSENGNSWKSYKASSLKENDFCITWKLQKLKPDTEYQYQIRKEIKYIVKNENLVFKTAPSKKSKSQISIAFGSGSGYTEGDGEVWNRIANSDIDGMILLGDTPYIDATELTVQRAKYKEFSRFKEFQKFAQSTPFWGTWDDHDFAWNDSDGTAKGKENSLKVFKEYRPNATFGNGKEGIYTKFSYGALEVFLLDTRWWSWTEPSFTDPSKKTLLGKTQWEWLKKSLKASKATFKIIACGMIWDDKENSEKDDWGTYMHERNALFNFIGENKIPGVVLIGGDIHVSRVLKYETENEVGYPLYQFITSPLHHRTIKSLNVPHPNLIRDAVIPHTFMKITVDDTVTPAVLKAEFIDKDGKYLFDNIIIDINELSNE